MSTCGDVVVVVTVVDNPANETGAVSGTASNGKHVDRYDNEHRRKSRAGTLGCILRLKRRISHRFGRMLSREDVPSVENKVNENVPTTKTMVICNGFSEEDFLQIVDEEPNGNTLDHSRMIGTFENGNSAGQRDADNQIQIERLTKDDRFIPKPVRRQLSAMDGPSHSRIISGDGDGDQSIVELRQRKPPRPLSECLVLDGDAPKSYRYSAFRGNSPFGKTDTYIKLDQLGEGSYATVYKGISNLNNKIVALKEIRLLEDEGTPFTAIREASLLKDLRHANIVTLHDIIHTKETLTFVFEFVNTDLSQYMERHGGGLHPRNVKLFLFQLLRGLAYIHDKRVLHRDLKPQNLLISEIGELKLADFGLARAKSVPSHTFSHEVVTLWYRPPDVLLGSTEYSTSLDMWGVGCIFIEMIIGVAIFPGIKDASDQLDKIWKVLGTPTEETWEGVSRYPNFKSGMYGRYKGQGLLKAFPKLQEIQQGESLASHLLQVQPQRRLLSKSAIRHQYFSDLPSKIYDLPNQVSIYNVPGCQFMSELHNQPLSVIRTAARLREKM